MKLDTKKRESQGQQESKHQMLGITDLQCLPTVSELGKTMASCFNQGNIPQRDIVSEAEIFPS